MDSISTSLSGAVKTDLGDGPSEQGVPSSNDLTTDDDEFFGRNFHSFMNSSCPTLPIYDADADREQDDLLRRIEALEKSGRIGGGSAASGTEGDRGERPPEQEAPTSRTDDLSHRATSSSSSDSLGVPFFDTGRKMWLDLLHRVNALEASRGIGVSNPGSLTVPLYNGTIEQWIDLFRRWEALNPPSAPPGFENFKPEAMTDEWLNRKWDMPAPKPDSDSNHLTAENGNSPTSPLSFRQRRPVGQDATMSASATSTPSQRSSSGSANQWQHVRFPQIDLDMSHVRPHRNLPTSPDRAQSPTPTESVSRGRPHNFYDRLSLATTSGVTLKAQLPSPKPSLNVFPETLINLANCHITFSVQAFNIPADVPLASCKAEGVAVSPSGRPIQCQLKAMRKTTIYEMDFFGGSFTSAGEVGLYQLKVRVILPFNPQWDLRMMAGVITGEAEILVSRNYYNQSFLYPAGSFQVEFTPWHYVPTNERMRNERKQGTSMTWEESEAGCLSKAWGLTVDKLTNRFYYTDRNSHSLSCLDAEGRAIFRIPQQGFNSQLCRPTGICCDEAHRRLIIVDKDNHRVTFFSMDGEFLASFGSRGHGPGQFNYPWDVAVSPGGERIVVTDSRNKRIQLFDRNGMFLNWFSVFEHSPYDYKSQFDYPRGVTFNKDGTSIFVTDFNSNNILEVPLSMRMYRRVLPEGKLQRPQGIVVDELDNLLLCDSKNMCIRHVHPAKGRILTSIHSVGKERLQFPVNLALIGDGRLAVLGGQGMIRIF